MVYFFDVILEDRDYKVNLCAYKGGKNQRAPSHICALKCWSCPKIECDGGGARPRQLDEWQSCGLDTSHEEIFTRAGVVIRQI
jgi:hypothetical protein